MTTYKCGSQIVEDLYLYTTIVNLSLWRANGTLQ